MKKKTQASFYPTSLTLKNVSTSQGDIYLGTLNWKTENQTKVFFKNLFRFSTIYFQKTKTIIMTGVLIHVKFGNQFLI